MSGTLRGEIWGLSFAVAHSVPRHNELEPYEIVPNACRDLSGLKWVHYLVLVDEPIGSEAGSKLIFFRFDPGFG